jgi:hypothetical protein
MPGKAKHAALEAIRIQTSRSFHPRHQHTLLFSRGSVIEKSIHRIINFVHGFLIRASILQVRSSGADLCVSRVDVVSICPSATLPRGTGQPLEHETKHKFMCIGFSLRPNVDASAAGCLPEASEYGLVRPTMLALRWVQCGLDKTGGDTCR